MKELLGKLLEDIYLGNKIFYTKEQIEKLLKDEMKELKKTQRNIIISTVTIFVLGVACTLSDRNATTSDVYCISLGLVTIYSFLQLSIKWKIDYENNVWKLEMILKHGDGFLEDKELESLEKTTRLSVNKKEDNN